MSPTITVIIATYNRGAGIGALLEDLDHQEGLDPVEFEVIVIDDGSSPPARPHVEAVTPRYPLLLLEQSNGGPGAARHNGIKSAQGEVIIVVDDDMRVGPGFIAAHREAHRTGAEVVQGAIGAPPHKVPVFERWHMSELEAFAKEIKAGRAQVRGAHLATGNVSFRRQRYFEVGGFDLSLKRSEDRDLGIRFEMAGAALAFSQDALSTHHSDHTSVAVWMGRAFRYGADDTVISRKHPNIEYVDPWRFLGEVNPVSRGFLLVSVFMPKVARPISWLAMQTSLGLDRVGLEKPAVAGTTLVYGMEYFRGMRQRAGSFKNAVHDMRTYRSKKRAAQT